MRIGNDVNRSADGIRELEKGGKTSEVKSYGNNKTKAKEKTSAVEGGEKVSVSKKAKEASTAKTVATATPDINEEKVAQIKARIKNGTYEVDADAIASKMIDQHLQEQF